MLNNTNERLTFFQLFNEKKYTIKVPIIQRDYAQGRATSTEVRQLFLDSLYDYLLENLKNRDLDFIYGSISTNKDNLFTPLDGQQRLTTLFLLHWYLANKDGKITDFVDVLTNKENKSMFTYEVRTSSREFCDALLANELNISDLLAADEGAKNSLSKTVMDSPWFFLSWRNDPTIKSMLVMLDAIHTKFHNEKTNGFYDRLISPDNPVITFQFLNLPDFKLTDDLYIKMNARGKQLTPYENFKAKFEQLIKKTSYNKDIQYKLDFNGIDKDVTVQEYFSHKIDTDWANLFWNYRDKKENIFDEQIMNFIRATAINHYASKVDVKYLDGLKWLINKANPTVSFQKYTELQCFDVKYIIELITLLDLLKNKDEKAKEYLGGFYYYNETSILNKVLGNSFDNFTQRVQFYAYCQYLIHWKSGEGLDNWMRVIHNLSENTIYNRELEYTNSIRSIKKLIPDSKDILSYLCEKKVVEAFNGQQIQEERVKALLIAKGEEWEKNYFGD